MNEFVEWKIKILQDSFSVSRKIFFCFLNAVIEYLNELHETFVLVLINKAANNIVITCKKYCVTVILKEIGILDTGNETYEKINKKHDEVFRGNL